MLISEFSELPEKMQRDEVLLYHGIMSQKKKMLLVKRIIDFLLCGFIFIISSPFFLIFSLLVGLTSKGGVFYKQQRVGRDMKPFYILKFRTMVQDADKKGLLLTSGNDSRITKVGKFLRKINMDEMPQLINVLKGDMSVIGTRPEVKLYVEEYTSEMLATLLIAPGMVSMASIYYKNENDLLTNALDPHEKYIKEILPDKMKYNLDYLKELSIGRDFKILIKTIKAAF